MLQGRSEKIFLLFLLSFFCIACDVKVKQLGRASFDPAPEDTANSETFKLNFAYQDTAAVSPGDEIIYLQGASNTKSTFNGICNAAGTGCECVLLNGATEVEVTNNTTISYDGTGNYFRCDFSIVPTPGTHTIKLRNLNRSKQTAVFDIKTPATVTLGDILGDLSLNKVRTIYRYGCDFLFWEKTGTTSASSITCTTGAQIVTTAPPQPAGSNLSIVVLNYFFYLFADNTGNNFGSKLNDLLYNAGGGETFCNIQLKRLDCTASNSQTNGAPDADFGLFSEASGIFTKSISLPISPTAGSATVGFAAATSTFGGATVCPPGLVRRVAWTATPTAETNTNMPTPGITATVIQSPTAPAISAITVTRRNNALCGDLDSNAATADNCIFAPCPTCTPAQPGITLSNYQASALATAPASANYASAGAANEFCVIPDTLLP